jgi:hypothetical protein
LHAKLVAFDVDGSFLCLGGSANFTTAAFDARNVETCLAWWQPRDPAADLFDSDVKRSLVKPRDFVSGLDTAPEDLDEPQADPLKVEEAHLDGEGVLTLSCSVNLPTTPDELSVALFAAGKALPAWSPAIPNADGREVSVQLPDVVLSQISDAASCALVATVNGRRIQGAPVWVLQEARLTHAPQSGESISGIQRQIEESGRGLVSHLEDLGARFGIGEVIDYLRNVRIHYFEGHRCFAPRSRRFLVRARDPLRPDSAAPWITEQAPARATLAEAIYEFVDRHERHVLLRHARRGNLNGLANFLDVFRTAVQLLFVYLRQGVLPHEQLIGRIRRLLNIVFTEAHKEQPEPEGYFVILARNYAGDMLLLREQLIDHKVPGYLYAALLVAQRARMAIDVAPTGNPTDYLEISSGRLRAALSIVGVAEPRPEDVREALREFEIISDEEACA